MVIRDMIRPLRMLEQHFKQVDEMFNKLYEIKPLAVEAVKHQEASATKAGVDKKKFEVRFDLKAFPAKNISVKTYGHNEVVIEAKYENKDDKRGVVSSQFYQSFTLPRGADSKDLTSKLSAEGILTVTVPKKAGVYQERVVPILQEEKASQ